MNPQLPMITVVTPSPGEGLASGSQVIWASKWVCVSMMPGISARPVGIDDFAPSAGVAANRGDAAAVNRKIAVHRRTRPTHHRWWRF